MSEKKITEKELEEILESLNKLVMDPTRVAIWFEILRKPGKTAKELMKIIKIQKTAMYYHLNILEENEILRGKVIKKQKHYHILRNFFELYSIKDPLLKEKKREFNLFSLYALNAFVQRQINKMMTLTDEELHNQKAYPIQRVGMWFCSEEKLDIVKEAYSIFYNKILEIDKGETPDAIQDTPMTFFWGLVDFE